MPEIKWGTADKVEKPPHVWKHADEPFWYVAVSVLSLVVIAFTVFLITLAVAGIWWPLLVIGIIVVIIAVAASVIFLVDYYDLY